MFNLLLRFQFLKMSKLGEETLYNQSTQPLYVLIDHNEKLLNAPRGYKSGIAEYIQWMDEGTNKFKK